MIPLPFALLALGCAGSRSEAPLPPEGAEEPRPTSTPPEAPEPPSPPCLGLEPCSATLALATWSPGEGGWTGYRMVAGESEGEAVVLVGTPSATPPTVTSLSVASLGWRGLWKDPDPLGSVVTSGFGYGIATSAVTGAVAVGATDGAEWGERSGALYVFDHAPVGLWTAQAEARATVLGTLHHKLALGLDIEFLDVDGSGESLLVGSGNADPPWENVLYRFDAELVGAHGIEVAEATITGAASFAQELVGWDGDGDGIEDVVASSATSVVRFPSPWPGVDLLEGDADVVWSERAGGDQLGFPLASPGDLDGDGAPDLVMAAPTYYGAYDRTGAVYVVRGGDLQSRPADDLDIQFHGDQLGDALGQGIGGGDFDGDGALDLVVGAAGLFPGHLPGRVLGFLGPLSSGTHGPSAAGFTVHGEEVRDMFGVSPLGVDADGDAQTDLVVAAQTADGGAGRVYLFAGADLVP